MKKPRMVRGYSDLVLSPAFYPGEIPLRRQPVLGSKDLRRSLPLRRLYRWATTGWEEALAPVGQSGVYRQCRVRQPAKTAVNCIARLAQGGVYGSPYLHEELHARGVALGRKSVQTCQQRNSWCAQAWAIALSPRRWFRPERVIEPDYGAPIFWGFRFFWIARDLRAPIIAALRLRYPVCTVRGGATG